MGKKGRILDTAPVFDERSEENIKNYKRYFRGEQGEQSMFMQGNKENKPL